jgi:hypothetical protein
MPGHDAPSVSGVIPADVEFHRWGLDFRQFSFGRIVRVSRHPALDASGRPPLSGHAAFPFGFRFQVGQVTQEPPSEFLPAAPGIQRSASRRTFDFRQSSFRRITRVPQRLAPNAWARALVGWHAVFSLPLSSRDKPSDPEIYLQSLPAQRGIQQSASWRSESIEDAGA